MLTRYFALIFGIVYVAVGILGFIPAINPLPGSHPALAVNTAYGYELGLFPINVLHNLVHLLIGVAGIAAYSSYRNARLFAQVLAVAYAVFGVAGFIPGLKDVFGLIPLFGLDILLHFASAIVAAYFGFFLHEQYSDAHDRGVAERRA